MEGKKEVDVIIRFNKNGITIEMHIPTPFGLETIVKKFSYEEALTMWNLEVREIKPKFENGILVEIILVGKLKGMVGQMISQTGNNLGNCIRRYFPNARGAKFRDLRAVVRYMMDGYSRVDAIKKRAQDRGVYPQTVHSNLTRGFKIDTDELDRRLNNILKCLKQQAGYLLNSHFLEASQK